MGRMRSTSVFESNPGRSPAVAVAHTDSVYLRQLVEDPEFPAHNMKEALHLSPQWTRTIQLRLRSLRHRAAARRAPSVTAYLGALLDADAQGPAASDSPTPQNGAASALSSLMNEPVARPAEPTQAA